jgi:hypothetical protein
MSSAESTLDDLFEFEAENSPLMGSRTAVFLDAEERFWLRQEEIVPPTQFGRFIGRTRELQLLMDAVARRAAIITVSGTAGVGKTALVQNVLQRFPGISHVLVENVDNLWSSVASSLLSIYGKVSLEAHHPESVRRIAADPRANPIVLVFDHIDRSPSTLRVAKRNLSQLLARLRPALGEWITAIVIARDARDFASAESASNTSIELQPLPTEARYSFLMDSAMDVGVHLESEALIAMAESSFGLPVILKSFLARSLEKSIATTTAPARVNLSSFCAAIEDSFADLALTYDAHILSVDRLQLSDWHFVEAVAKLDIFSELYLSQLETTVARDGYGPAELNRTIRRLVANDVIKMRKSTRSFFVHSHLLFPYIRALSRREMFCSAGSESEAFLLLLAAAKRARKETADKVR